MINPKPNEVAPCGVFCAVCPAFGKTCLGCSSDAKKQKRKSKWGCKLRLCCYEKQNINYCIDCSNYPCGIYTKKLSDTHPGDKRFAYRHELPEVLKILKQKGVEEFIRYQKERYKCPTCGDIICFYYYTCSKCGKEINIR